MYGRVYFLLSIFAFNRKYNVLYNKFIFLQRCHSFSLMAKKQEIPLYT